MSAKLKKKILAAAMLAGISAGAANAQTTSTETVSAAQPEAAVQASSPRVSGTLDAVLGDDFLDHYGRIQSFYSLPKGWSGFTFMEVYQHGAGYFGITFISGPGRITPVLEIGHANSVASNAGIGIKVNANVKGFSYLSFDAKPLFAKGGDAVDQIILGTSFGLNVPHMNVNAFGRLDLKTGKWDYGEATVAWQTKHFEAGYNPALINKGKALPGIDHRLVVSVRYKF